MRIKGQHRRLDLPQFVRLAPTDAVSDLGPLTRLVGTWSGSRGWNLIAVPTPGQPKSFTLLVRPYYEMITFTPLGALVPDRGASEILNIVGVEYSLRVSDLLTNEPLHLENGMWLYTHDRQAPPGSPTIVRQAAIPHGNSLLALGSSRLTEGAPVIHKLPTRFVGTPVSARLGYDEPYRNPPPPVPGQPPFNIEDANEVLREAIKGQTISDTLTLSVSTQQHGGGGIVNIPFIKQNANPTSFHATFWIETVKNPETGEPFDQLQYSQQTNLAFIKCGRDCSKEGDGLVVWPHVNVNTLVRQ